MDKKRPRVLIATENNGKLSFVFSDTDLSKEIEFVVSVNGLTTEIILPVVPKDKMAAFDMLFDRKMKLPDARQTPYILDLLIDLQTQFDGDITKMIEYVSEKGKKMGLDVDKIKKDAQENAQRELDKSANSNWRFMENG